MSDRSLQSSANSAPIEGENSPVTSIMPVLHQATPRVAAALRGSSGSLKRFLRRVASENERAEIGGRQTRTPIALPGNSGLSLFFSALTELRAPRRRSTQIDGALRTYS